MLIGWLATRTAQTSSSLGMQYFAYAAYVVAEALIFVPLLYIADRKAPGRHRQRHLDHGVRCRRLDGGRAPHAQGLLFPARHPDVGRHGGADPAMIGGAVFGFQLGTWFSVAMIGFAGAAVLVRHVQHHSPLSGRPLCVRGDAAVRIDRADVLVRAASGDGQPQLDCLGPPCCGRYRAGSPRPYRAPSAVGIVMLPSSVDSSPESQPTPVPPRLPSHSGYAPVPACRFGRIAPAGL